jgi:hypothetical protein
MSARTNAFMVCSGVLFLALLVTGCTTADIGEAAYTNGSITIPVTSTGGPSTGYIQVTVYEIKNNQQVETDVLFAPLSLGQGQNTAIVPGILKPGQYKLYIYLIQNSERKAAVIRDIMVS